MGSRLELHTELLKFAPNVYFQPPSNIKMAFPCIVYAKRPHPKKFANNAAYISKQRYQLTVMTSDADSTVGEELESHFEYCGVTNEFTLDNLHHTFLNLYY